MTLEPAPRTAQPEIAQPKIIPMRIWTNDASRALLGNLFGMEAGTYGHEFNARQQKLLETIGDLACAAAEKLNTQHDTTAFKAAVHTAHNDRYEFAGGHIVFGATQPGWAKQRQAMFTELVNVSLEDAGLGYRLAETPAHPPAP